MKKYLFLLVLFIIYIGLLLFDDKSNDVVVLEDLQKGAYKVSIEFDNGINSNDLKALFDDYDKNYFVYLFLLNNKRLDLSCDSIEQCIKNVYDVNDNDFYLKYVTNGFKIDEVELIAYKDEILSFLNKNNLTYKLF